MALKKKIKKKAKRKSKKKPPVFNELKKIFLVMAVLASICLTLAMVADILLKPEKSVEKKEQISQKRPDSNKIKPIQEDFDDVKTIKTTTGLKQKLKQSIKYEVFEEIDQTLIEKKFPKPEKGHIPKIVIVIDDIGYDKAIALELSRLEPNLTFSILPFAPFGKTIARQLHANGSQIMLHLPMEPFEYPSVNPGPGAILSSMAPDALINQLERNINNIDYVAGVNNHMGSKITTNAAQMNQIFTVLKKKNLFFIDSRTTSESKCEASARLFRLKFAQRDIFLDNYQNSDYITRQLKKLKKIAEKHGFAIGIGHPYKATLNTLARELPKLRGKVEIVRAGTLASIPG